LDPSVVKSIGWDWILDTDFAESNAPMMDDLLTARQLQDLLKVDRTTIYHMLRAGRLPGFKVGGQWRFSRADIETWLTAKQFAHLGVPAANAAAETVPFDFAPSAADALPLHCIQPIQNLFAEALDVAAVTTTLEGDPITSFSNLGPFCSLIQASEEGRRRCRASWQELGRSGNTQPLLTRCHAGLHYAGGRVQLGDEFMAVVFAGQFRVEDQELDVRSVRKLAAACGLAPSGLLVAAGNVPVLSQSQSDRVLRLLQVVAATFSQIGQERQILTQRLRRISEMSSL
jgi:excisionase family DNA binding protein